MRESGRRMALDVISDFSVEHPNTLMISFISQDP